MNPIQKFVSYFKHRMQEIEQEEYDKGKGHSRSKPTPESPKSNVWTDPEVEQFRNKLIQAITWTDALVKDFDFENGQYGLVFRQTNPLLEGRPLYSFNGDRAEWTSANYSYKNYDALLKLASEVRPLDGTFDFQRLADCGRILCFQTCITTHDGVAIEESRHFIDGGDVPPIDTWFYLKRDYFHANYRYDQSLFCWIPKRFIAVMQQAMDVEILDSYCWLDENDPEMYARILHGV